ncbi:ATP-binding protein [Paenibacillus naphthalenovorans]|uniref:ATP-binding protein n=1 Tax=Paenibacillus naphthalenovorans TaxID=162209 RepID=UPI003D2C3CB7
MKLERVIIRNFRSYREEIQIPFDNLTAFIGKNDVGKSTILEALEIFFNNSTVKIDQSDACVYGTDKKVVIGCVFSDLPTQVILDSQVSTDFAREHLLNSNGELEIRKVYDCNLKTPKETVFAVCSHPSKDETKDLIKLKNAELKTRARSLGIDLANIDQRSNPVLRDAIRNKTGDLQLQEQMLPLNEENAKAVWESIAKIMPQYALFQADRPSNDEDSEVQDPMKYAIGEAIKAVEEDLHRIKETVHSQVLAVATRTLDKLREMDPGLANELAPRFKTEPKWDGLFKLSLTSDDQIPINKRGSGVRRLILLNFFRAEAERKQKESGSPGIIYAIEEPETAQHPNNQKMLVEALTQLSQTENCQVILTTHVPGLAGLLSVEQLRYIEALPDGGRKITYKDAGVFKRIADQLGVLPDSRVKVFICVEGPHDVRFLNIMSKMLHNVNPNFPDLENDPRIAMFHLGGSTLKDWVTSNYLKGLGIPEIHIYDRDEGAKPKYLDECNAVNRRGDRSKAFITGKREMENYLHPDAIKEVYGINIAFSEMDDVSELVAKTLQEQGSEQQWEELSEEKKKKKVSRVKARLNTEVASRMTYERLCEMDTSKEVENWLGTVSVLLTLNEAKDMAAPGLE